MGYVAFALKYRPQNFDEVVGQEKVVTALKNAILKDRIHHAYLFSGPRGVGKTSLARIFAKSLNCEKGPTILPCEECLSCREITKGTSLDVVEIDGASNRGIDEIRELRETVKLSSAHSRYKIYIIDEVHMLTQEAFNALLKTLEEPPPHVKFIFATTHPQKILPTILSRCQKFQFNLLPIEKIINKLEAIVKKEGIEIDKSILYAIARSSEGSIRDAESLLDQLVPVIMSKIKIEDVISFLGIIDEDTLNKMVKFILEKDITLALDFIQQIIDSGKDLGIFTNALIEHFRYIMIAKVSPKTFANLFQISPFTKDYLKKLSESVTIEDILKIIDLLIEAKELSKKLNSIRIPLELEIVKFSSSNRGMVLSKGNNLTSSQKANSREENNNNSFASKEQASIENSFDKGLDIKKVEYHKEDGDIEEVVGEDSNFITFDNLKEKWEEVISEISKTKVSLASYLREAVLESFNNNILRVVFPKKYSFHKEVVEENKNTRFVEGVFLNKFGMKVRLKCLINKEEEAVNSCEDDTKKLSETKDDNTFIDELLDTFKGNIYTEDV
ncbi:MAG: DNA polymerase III subunit gamma/tau [Candidatus Omnitrophica bacterium]|nr:DNA polymerase III subunit gamma/tau [Candidatus Omnitrophota bacterium]MCM8826323.1 DNA polymerase III subunit gamma/tau [Candidatus Omnitrophota bacterium]